MDPGEYELTKQVQNQHWIWRGRRKIIDALIFRFISSQKKLMIADIGCGFGANIPVLQKYGTVTALEMNDGAIEFVKSKFGSDVTTIKWRSPERLQQSFDLIVLADVLEHVPDDQQMANWIFDHLNDGGHVLLTVPAHQLLWTEMDEVVHHFRRYSKKQLIKLFEEKFTVKYFSFYNFFLFPVKCCFVLFSRLNRLINPSHEPKSYNEIPPTPINECFYATLSLEAQLMRHCSFPIGASIVFMARKNA